MRIKTDYFLGCFFWSFLFPLWLSKKYHHEIKNKILFTMEPTILDDPSIMSSVAELSCPYAMRYGDVVRQDRLLGSASSPQEKRSHSLYF